MATPRPPVTVEMDWDGEMRFRGRAGSRELALDGDARSAVTPVEALVLALAGCMSSDVVHILVKGRTPPTALSARLVAERAPDEPRRVVNVNLRFSVRGAVPAEKIERAIALSHDKYCSVWHSMRPDIAFTTSFELRP